MPCSGIQPRNVLTFLQTVEAKSDYETAKCLRATIGEVLRYAVATLRAETDPTPVLHSALISRKVRHMPAIFDAPTFARVAWTIWTYEGRARRDDELVERA
ncbi:MAG TPA: integrase, partial [Hyphomonas sp.]|nr:integrase [Hyphomonas sp.]